MSNQSKAIAEIKNLMVKFGFMTSENAPLSFKTVDDIILNTMKLEAGANIYKINEAFEQVVLEDGTYKLKENFELEVKEGQIVSVRELFLDAKLEDGTPIKVLGESLVEGAEVKVITEQGELPAPDGVHILVDGTKVETKEGKVVSVEEAVKEEEPMLPESEGGEVEIKVEAKDEVMEMLKDFVKKMGEKMGQMEEKMSSIQSDFNAFKSAPAAKKIADGKTDFNKQEKLSSVDLAVEQIMMMRKK